MEIFRGDIFYIRNNGADPVGREIYKDRPAVVVSNDIINKSSELITVVYLTSKAKRHLNTHVPVMCRVPSFALCEQIYAVSTERIGEYVRSCTPEEMAAIETAVKFALGLDSEPEPASAYHKNDFAEIELEVYKDLYKQLLNRFTEITEMIINKFTNSKN